MTPPLAVMVDTLPPVCASLAEVPPPVPAWVVGLVEAVSLGLVEEELQAAKKKGMNDSAHAALAMVLANLECATVRKDVCWLIAICRSFEAE
jgi:hypothetical protein